MADAQAVIQGLNLIERIDTRLSTAQYLTMAASALAQHAKCTPKVGRQVLALVARPFERESWAALQNAVRASRQAIAWTSGLHRRLQTSDAGDATTQPEAYALLVDATVNVRRDIARGANTLILGTHMWNCLEMARQYHRLVDELLDPRNETMRAQWSALSWAVRVKRLGSVTDSIGRTLPTQHTIESDILETLAAEGAGGHEDMTALETVKRQLRCDIRRGTIASSFVSSLGAGVVPLLARKGWSTM